MSTDGGQTWTGAPSAGLPAGARPLLAAQTPLRDGALVVAFASQPDAARGTPSATVSRSPQGTSLGSVTCYRWAIGASAWQPLTPAVTLGGSYVANVYVANNGQPAVTLSAADDFTSNPTYTLVPFTSRTSAGG